MGADYRGRARGAMRKFGGVLTTKGTRGAKKMQAKTSTTEDTESTEGT